MPRAVIVGLRDIYHPSYPAYEMRITEQYRADIFLEEFEQFERDGNLLRLNILCLPPLNQFDLAAQPMFSVFTPKPDLTPYKALPNQISLDEMNPSLAGLTGLQRQLAEFSLGMERSEPDAADANLLNRAIWHSVKGFDTPYNHGRPLSRRHDSFQSLLRLAGN